MLTTNKFNMTLMTTVSELQSTTLRILILKLMQAKGQLTGKMNSLVMKKSEISELYFALFRLPPSKFKQKPKCLFSDRIATMKI